VLGVVAGALVVVIGIDAAVFRWANRVSKLAALAVQLALDGLADVGVIHLIQH
jgi:hypothetical protein